jgi:hypothetical protein
LAGTLTGWLGDGKENFQLTQLDAAHCFIFLSSLMHFAPFISMPDRGTSADLEAGMEAHTKGDAQQRVAFNVFLEETS